MLSRLRAYGTAYAQDVEVFHGPRGGGVDVDAGRGGVDVDAEPNDSRDN